MSETNHPAKLLLIRFVAARLRARGIARTELQRADQESSIEPVDLAPRGRNQFADASLRLQWPVPDLERIPEWPGERQPSPPGRLGGPGQSGAPPGRQGRMTKGSINRQLS